ncbi:hypothetical protein CVO77_03650 [Sphingopyxis lindanitolerans]|uniref:Uncharacterized protein n=1 Tax=Sphingopyxis lindanitolerans TaxID=2054227 RepID=A0A2S8B5T0_9SPHN|nr:hypothetical protein [Sphingopyxis lindanitolerans]PQM27676.1 hypothetical protein CVO77_03650 [Sphingopyxis lindanitolerans]
MRNPAQDPTSFYDTEDAPGLPIAQNVDDIPAAPPGEAFAAGWRTAKDDWPGESINQLISAYSPLIDAVKAETGKPETEYIAIGHSNAWVQEARVFRDIARIRAKKPNFLPGVPDSVDAFRASVTKRTQERRGKDLQTLERTEGVSTVTGYAGGFAGAAADPINVMTLPLGGTGATVARRIIGEAAVNIATEAIEQPMIAGEREKRGEKLTAGEAATNIAVAGVAGAVIQGGIVEPASAFLRRHRERRLTPAERAAVNVVEREAQVDATSPFKPGSGTEAHRERMAEAERVLDGEQPPRPVRPVSPKASRETVKAKIRRAESSPTDDYNEISGAMGPYQFLASTWTRFYKRRYGSGGLTDAEIAAKRRDPVLNEQLMDDMLAENERALASTGARATPGNLYLAHFAGSGGAKAVLRAAPDMPVSRILGKRAVDANPFLRGMTAEDLIQWAHRKVGGDPDGPTLRRDEFSADEEWMAAQREVDAAEQQLAISRARDADDLDATLAVRREWDDAEPRAFDLWPDGDDADTLRLYRADTPDAEGATFRGYTDDEAAARSAAGESGAIYKIDVPVARADELAPVAKTGERRVARDIADAIERKVEPPTRATVAADAVDDWIISRHMIPETGPSGYRVEQADDGSFATVVLRGHDGRAKAGLLIPTHPEAIDNFGGVITYVSPDIRRKGIATRLYNIAREAGLPIDAMSGRGDLTPDGAEFVRSWRERSAPLRAQGIEHYDDAIHGEGPRTVTQSLEHDLRMAVAANPDEMMRVNDEGGDVRLADVLDELDADDNALIAARACMVPMRGA